MKFILYGGLLAIVGAFAGFPIGLFLGSTLAPIIAPDWSASVVCGNTYGDPGMVIGLVAGLVLGLSLAYRSSKRAAMLPPTNT